MPQRSARYLSIRLTPEREPLIREVEEIAKTLRLSRTEVLMRAVEAGIDEQREEARAFREWERSRRGKGK